MINIIIDGFSEKNKEVLNSKIDEFAGIVFFNKNNKILAFFERITNENGYNWIWSKNESVKYNYTMNIKTISELIKEMSKTFDIKEEDISIRLYSEFDEFVMPKDRRLQETEIISEIEMKRLGEENLKLLRKDNPDIDTSENEVVHSYLTNDILNLIKIISAQGHTSETISVTMNIIERLLRRIPLTPLYDEKENEIDWVELNSEEIEKSKDIYILENEEITSIWVNIRCPRIVKVKFSDDTIKYFDNRGKVYVYDNRLFYDPKTSVVEVSMPWEYGNTSHEYCNDEEDVKDMVEM